MLSVNHLTKTYGSQRALNNISFTAQPGEITGFLGPNGAGKSTTMKIACGYLSPDSGTAEVCGFDIGKKPLEAKRFIGYLPEHNPLYLDMYVHEYLSFTGALYGMRGAGLRKQAAEIAERVGLGPEQNKKIAALSKGYRQRVGLASALIHNPEVLILDEPTTGLDPNQIVEIRSLIKEAGLKKTVLFSTHIMQEVQALCDRVIIINAGTIAADSSLAVLKAGSEGRQTLTAEFEADLDMNLLKALPGVVQVKRIAAGKYLLQTEPGSELRSQLVKTAAAHNLPLVGLQVQEETLETVFRRLTGGV